MYKRDFTAVDGVLALQVGGLVFNPSGMGRQEEGEKMKGNKGRVGGGRKGDSALSPGDFLGRAEGGRLGMWLSCGAPG